MIPQPGAHAGWVVYYGRQHEHQVWCHQDYEHAVSVAVRMHGVLVAAVAGAFSPNLAQKPWPNAQDAHGAS